MKQFIKISVLLLTGAQYTNYCHAQWTAQDSLKLKKYWKEMENLN